MKSLLLAIVLLTFVPLTSYAQSPTDSREEIRDRLLEQRENARDQISDTQVQIAQEAADRRQEFKDRLESIQDTRRKQILENIDNKISNLNSRYTTALGAILGKLENITNRMEAKITQLEAEGTDVSSVTPQLEEAKLQIQNAASALETQADKDYIFDLTDNTTLRQAAQSTVAELRSDLADSKKAVTDAKNTVVKAARALNQID